MKSLCQLFLNHIGQQSGLDHLRLSISNLFHVNGGIDLEALGEGKQHNLTSLTITDDVNLVCITIGTSLGS